MTQASGSHKAGDQAPPRAVAADTSAGGDSTSLLAAGRSAALLSVGVLASQAFVAAREIFVASQTGTSSSLDAMYVGILLPLAFGGVLTSGTAAALVPVYLSASSSGSGADARRYAGVVLMWVFLGSLALSVGLEVFAADVVAIVGSGLSAADKANATTYLRIAAPVVTISGIFGILAAVCQALRQFRPIALAIVLNSATVLVVMILLWDAMRFTGYALAIVVGAVVGVLVVGVAMSRLSVLPRPRLRVRNMPARAFLHHAVPLTISASFLQINTVLNATVATILQPGSVSALRFGNLLVNVPVGAFSVAWGSAMYPTLVGSSLETDASSLARVTDRSLRYALAMFIPIASLTMALAPLAVYVVFGRGMFTEASIELTASVVVGMAPMIALAMAMPVLVGTLNARRRGTLLLAAGIMNVTLNAVLSVVLGLSLGVIGVALASSITLGIVVVFLARRVARMDHHLQLRPIAMTSGRAVLAAAPATALVAMIAWNSWSGLTTQQGLLGLVLFGGAGLISYVIVAPRLGLGEPRVLLDVAIHESTQRLRRR